MSIKILDGREREARPAASGPTWPLWAIPRKYPVAWAIAWTALLLILCLAPARALPDENAISIRRYIPHADLAVHFTLFAGFAASWLGAVRSPWRWALVPVAGLLLAVATEYAQGLSFIRRDPDWLDGMADSFGVLAGLTGMALLRPRTQSSRMP